MQTMPLFENRVGPYVQLEFLTRHRVYSGGYGFRAIGPVRFDTEGCDGFDIQNTLHVEGNAVQESIGESGTFMELTKRDSDILMGLLKSTGTAQYLKASRPNGELKILTAKVNGYLVEASLE